LLDNLQYKVDISKNRAKEFGINVKSAICGDAANLEKNFTDKRFDCVFLDSPCTGLGTLRRHPEIRWRLTQDKITEAAQLDLRLLNSAASVVAAGGCLIYATCTVTTAEDTSVVSKFLKSDVGSKFKLLPFEETPVYKPNLSRGMPDAHFCAVLKKIG
jgi:16S rRNA (cytosine967-C5)-methyltransferase